MDNDPDIDDKIAELNDELAKRDETVAALSKHLVAAHRTIKALTDELATTGADPNAVLVDIEGNRVNVFVYAKYGNPPEADGSYTTTLEAFAETIAIANPDDLEVEPSDETIAGHVASWCQQARTAHAVGVTWSDAIELAEWWDTAEAEAFTA